MGWLSPYMYLPVSVLPHCIWQQQVNSAELSLHKTHQDFNSSSVTSHTWPLVQIVWLGTSRHWGLSEQFFYLRIDLSCLTVTVMMPIGGWPDTWSLVSRDTFRRTISFSTTTVLSLKSKNCFAFKIFLKDFALISINITAVVLI